MKVSDQVLHQQLAHTLTDTDFTFLGEKYSGKVRDCYGRGNERILITSDRLSCFDVVVASIPFKGQVLTELAGYWFERTKHIVANHVIDIPDPNVIIGRNCQILPIEVVVRQYLAGSAGRDYEAGRAISGIKLPPGLKAHQRLPELIVTPSTKAPRGDHDLPISAAEIVSRGIISAARWDEIRSAALALFSFAAKEVESRGLLMVDTKYEFGLIGDELVLADEVHTLDCSRFWIASSYPERFASGETPEMLDKEPIRQWLLNQGYSGNGPIPEFTSERRVEIARHYLDSFRLITGKELEPQAGDPRLRIEQRLRERYKFQ